MIEPYYDFRNLEIKSKHNHPFLENINIFGTCLDSNVPNLIYTHP